MPASARPFAQLRTRDQWLRAAHDGTTVDAETDSVELDWSVIDPPAMVGEAQPLGAGLAFDAECRLYHSVPDEGRIEKILAEGTAPDASDLLTGSSDEDLGDFSVHGGSERGLLAPRGLAVDIDDRLYVADQRRHSVAVLDLWSERLLRKIPFGSQPVDVAAHGRDVFVAAQTPPRVYRITARRGPFTVPLSAAVTVPSRIAVDAKGRIFVLDSAGTDRAAIYPLDAPSDAFTVRGATDIEFDSDDVLVVARRPGESFLRFKVTDTSIAEETPLKARGYDGLGIVRVPGPKGQVARIGYWTKDGFRRAIAARLAYEKRGRVTTYQLDSGQYQTQWGRVFLDACVPEGTDIKVAFLALDEVNDDEPAIDRARPAKLVKEVLVRPDLSPPMPPIMSSPASDAELDGLLHRRESGRELPYTERPKTDPFATYEAPITAPPGRYLWVYLELLGNTRTSPRIRAVRAEYPTHDYLRRIPKTFSRDEKVADFLRRFLAMFEGFLFELEGRAAGREALVMPRATSAELLGWLAGFVGLVLDDRWTEDQKRTFIEEAILLFRFRGTLGSLQRMLEIVLGIKPILLEHYRLRGLGSLLGGEDAVKARAHRFSVIIPAVVSKEMLDIVDHILDVHRPAHTLYDVCTVGAGMRVGMSLYLELSSIIGRTGGFETIQLGRSLLGRGGIVGRPEAGPVAGISLLGQDSRVG